MKILIEVKAESLEDNEYLTKHGWVKAKDLNIGDKIHSITGFVTNIEEVDKIPYIILTRDDLSGLKANFPIDEICLHDFKHSSVKMSEIYRADLVLFKDGNEIRELKNRNNF